MEQPAGRDLNDVFYFWAVVRHRGFGAASRATGIPKSRLSRRVRELEDRLGALLIQRSTSRFEVTSVGEMFFAHCETALGEIEQAENATQFFTGEPRGLLRVSMPPGDCAEAVSKMLPGFLADYPNVRVEMVVAMRRVDMIAEQMDVAIRARTRLDSEQDLIVKQLMTLHGLLVASPALVERLGMPGTVEELRRFPTLGTGGGAGTSEWSIAGPDGTVRPYRHHPIVSADDIPTVVNLCESGLGVAMVPEVMAKSALKAGRLVRLLPGHRSDSVILHMAFPSRRGMLPSVRLFIDRVATALVAHFDGG